MAHENRCKTLQPTFARNSKTLEYLPTGICSYEFSTMLQSRSDYKLNGSANKIFYLTTTFKCLINPSLNSSGKNEAYTCTSHRAKCICRYNKRLALYPGFTPKPGYPATILTVSLWTSVRVFQACSSKMYPHVSYTGQSCGKRAALVRVYSPEMVATLSGCNLKTVAFQLL
jgi:hypothetical protein